MTNYDGIYRSVLENPSDDMIPKTSFEYDCKTAGGPVIEKVELRPILFADLDGACLNGHERHENGYCGSRPDIVKNFNRVIAETDCLIVIVSAWRYLVHGGRMTIQGLEACLLTHGVDCENRVAGVTRKDIEPYNSDRGQQVIEWLRAHPQCDGKFAAVDDLELDYDMHEIPFVHTDSGKGLTTKDAKELILLLKPLPDSPGGKS